MTHSRPILAVRNGGFCRVCVGGYRRVSACRFSYIFVDFCLSECLPVSFSGAEFVSYLVSCLQRVGIQKTILNSVPRTSGEMPNDGRWLTQDAANAASDCFETTADLLPGQPFVYSSHKGDLVAEFQAQHGNLTSIVSPTFVLLFATVNGVTLERKVTNARTLREEVRRLMEPLLTGQHGDLETAK